MAQFTALVLAGARKSSGDDLNGGQLKALLTLDGMPMIDRVISALAASKCISRIVVCGPADLGDWPGVTFFPMAASPARSFLAFLESQWSGSPLLVTTADHALLTTEMVEHFCAQTLAQGTDFTIGMADQAMVQDAYAGTRRTGYRFRDGAWCSCNLFGVTSPKVADVIHFWGFVEQNRKKPLKVVAAFGWLTLLGVLLRVWTLQDALRHAAMRFGITASAVVMPWAEAAIDVDTLSDKTLAESILVARTVPAE
jgi:hypothetical protein